MLYTTSVRSRWGFLTILQTLGQEVVQLEGHEQGMQIILYYNFWKKGIKSIQKLVFSCEGSARKIPRLSLVVKSLVVLHMNVYDAC